MNAVDGLPAGEEPHLVDVVAQMVNVGQRQCLGRVAEGVGGWQALHGHVGGADVSRFSRHDVESYAIAVATRFGIVQRRHGADGVIARQIGLNALVADFRIAARAVNAVDGLEMLQPVVLPRAVLEFQGGGFDRGDLALRHREGQRMAAVQAVRFGQQILAGGQRQADIEQHRDAVAAARRVADAEVARRQRRGAAEQAQPGAHRPTGAVGGVGGIERVGNRQRDLGRRLGNKGGAAGQKGRDGAKTVQYEWFVSIHFMTPLKCWSAATCRRVKK